MTVTKQFTQEEAAEVAQKLGIALAHLKEIPDYYNRLKKMEADAERK